MRRRFQGGFKATQRAIVGVEFLEDRQLLSADAVSVGSLLGSQANQTSTTPINVPTAIGHKVAGTPLVVLPSGLASDGPFPFASNGPAVAAPYTPAQIRHAYGVDQLKQDGTGQTIAIIDAYDDPSVATDLTTFDQTFGLPVANFVKATPQGMPAANSGWSLEIALDVEWAHVIAPAAKILLVETLSATDSSLLSGVDYAVTQGASQVSMSWGGSEFSGESSLDTHFNHPGVTFLASSGDAAGQLNFPAISPYVTSVGGTTVSLDATGNKLSESAWSNGGGGLSTQVNEPAYQVGFLAGTKRGTPDVAYDADPNSGVYVYENSQWYQVGGTSAGAPQWAGLIALANQGLSTAGKASLGTGQPYGTNTVLYQLAGGTSYTNPNGDFTDITTGSNSHPATVGYDLATGLGSPVANQLIPDLIGPSTTKPNGPTPGDSGFESVSVGNGSYSYNPTGSAWTFSHANGGGSGVTGNNSAFTGSNSAAPQGSQVGFIQNVGSITQSVTNWSAGSYTIAFQAAQRGNWGTSVEDFEILVDGNIVGSFKPTTTSYQAYSTASFIVTAGAHSVQFLGLDTAGGDNTVFLDAVSVAVAVTSPSTSPTPGDSGFETVSVGNGSYSYNPTGSAWTFSQTNGGGSGVTGNNSAFTGSNPAAPQGSQVGFIQNVGSITQSVTNWSAGSYTIAFQAAQRGNWGTSVEDFEILVDGNIVGIFKPTTTSYQAYSTASFIVTAGAHSVQFLGLDTAGGDNTVFLDAVSVAVAVTSPSTSPTPGDSGFETVPVGNGSYSYNPTGSAWTFSQTNGGGSGVTGNNSAFTGSNSAAPQGSQVGFIQNVGSITQSVTNWSAGSYTIAFQAAQRGNWGTSVEDFEILVDGNIVGSFKPTTTSYQAYSTASFIVTAGAHSVQFLGLDTAGGDNTVFLDAVTIGSK